MRKIDEIIIHCAATRPGWREDESTISKIEEVRRWHVDGRGWSDIGYHFLIDRDGTVEAGRPVSRAGAHVRGHNRNSIGICLFGGHGAAATDNFYDHFTPEQDAALRKLIDTLVGQYGSLDISGHNEYSVKGCPGFQVGDWLEAGLIQHTDPAEQPQGLLSLIASILAGIFGGRK